MNLCSCISPFLQKVKILGLLVLNSVDLNIFSSVLTTIYVLIMYFYLIAGVRPSSIKMNMCSNHVQQLTQESLMHRSNHVQQLTQEGLMHQDVHL